MPTKPKVNQPETPKEIQERDLFMTPNYATDLLIPFLNKRWQIWECAAGNGKIVNRLESNNFTVFGSELQTPTEYQNINFLLDKPIHQLITYGESEQFCIITNPPYSLKGKFYKKCLEYKVPFALLIPADYSGWIINAIQNGAEKIIPSRRIDYITPNILQNIWKGEVKKLIEKETGQKFKNHFSIPDGLKNKYSSKVKKYYSIEECPNELLAKYSTSQFHSMWLTWRFGLGKSETFVELTKEMKQNI